MPGPRHHYNCFLEKEVMDLVAKACGTSIAKPGRTPQPAAISAYINTVLRDVLSPPRRARFRVSKARPAFGA